MFDEVAHHPDPSDHVERSRRIPIGHFYLALKHQQPPSLRLRCINAVRKTEAEIKIVWGQAGQPEI
jgi:hypothetical protein